jgi:hypothetical protein
MAIERSMTKKPSTAKGRAEARKTGAGTSNEGGKHRPKDKNSKNDDRARRR